MVIAGGGCIDNTDGGAVVVAMSRWSSLLLLVMAAVSQSEVLGRFYNPNTTPKRQRESSGLPAQNWTGVALKGVLHQGD